MSIINSLRCRLRCNVEKSYLEIEINSVAREALTEIDALLDVLHSKNEVKLIEMLESIEDLVEVIELATDSKFMEELNEQLEEILQKNEGQIEESEIREPRI